MKEIITKEMVEKVTVKYEANDGKTFPSEYECQAYESSKEKDMLNLKWGALKKCVLNDWEYRDYYMVLVNSPDDLITAIGYMNFYYDHPSIESSNDFSKLKYPTVIEFDVNPDGYMYICETEAAKYDADKIIKFGDETKELYKEITD